MPRRSERFWERRRRRINLSQKMLAHAMKKAGHTYRDIGKALDISISSVHLIVRHEGPVPEKLVSEIKKRSIAHHRLLAEQILSTIDDKDIRNATLRTKVIASAILTDKTLLMEKSERATGQPHLIEQVIEHAQIEDSADNSTT